MDTRPGQPAHEKTPVLHRWRRAGLIGFAAAAVAAGMIWQSDRLWPQIPVNRLGDELSPYLQLHAHNPVDWYPWGPEALARAKREDKPIFLSIGYSTCYWCHVMERKVFSDPDIAALMNAHFINIKVDREERPDLDGVYMTATYVMTGSGGWPNSVFLTPDLQPFYAGTYFPPVDMPGRPAFPRLLAALSEAWRTRRSEVVSHAEAVANAIRDIHGEDAAPAGVRIDRTLVDQAIARLQQRYDAQNGGFGGAPKFPPALELELMLHNYLHSGDDRMLSIVTHTLDAMAQSGMYDQIGGGFHRYATDSRWRVPHFEKMLYNQADLGRVYLLAYQATGNETYRRTAEDVLTYVAREMRDEHGAFYSAMDAETDGVEGVYYLWTEPEIREALGDDAEAFLTVYALAPMPEGEGGVVYMAHSFEEAASRMQMTPEQLQKRLTDLKTRLLKIRSKRKRPLVDTKVLTAWNGMMIDTFGYAYEVTGHPEYRDTARNAAAFVLERLRDKDGTLKRVYRDGRVERDAFQEDYAFLIRALLRLHRITKEPRWLNEAQRLNERMIDIFWDDAHGGFFFTDGSADPLVRTKQPEDVSIPSGNSVAAHNLLELAHHAGQPAYADTAQRLFRAFAGDMAENPGRFSHMLLAVHRSLTMDSDAVSSNGPASKPAFPLQFLAAPTPPQNVVHATLRLSPPQPAVDRPFKAVVRLRIATDWHVNANPASMSELIPTNVTFNADAPIEVVSIDYPDGVMERFGFAERPLSVYQGEMEIMATLRIKPGARLEASSRLRATVTYQPCNDTVCLAPVETLLSAALR